MLWRIDLACSACDWTLRDYWCHRGDPWPPCRHCGEPAVRAWLPGSFPGIIGDEIDYVDTNLTSKPIRFTSKAERKRLMQQLGKVECVEHVGVPGTDKSKHTTRWT